MGKSGGGDAENGVIGATGQRPRPCSRGSRARAPAAPGRGCLGNQEPASTLGTWLATGTDSGRPFAARVISLRGFGQGVQRGGVDQALGFPPSMPGLGAPRHAFSSAFLSSSAAPSSLGG